MVLWISGGAKNPIWGKCEIGRLWWTIRGESWCFGCVIT
jgi:hypothetical protein